MLDRSEVGVLRVELGAARAKSVLHEEALGLVAPEELDESVDQLAVPGADVAGKDDERVLGQDRARRIRDVGLEPALAAIGDRLLLVRDERVAEAVLELGA